MKHMMELKHAKYYYLRGRYATKMHSAYLNTSVRDSTKVKDAEHRLGQHVQLKFRVSLNTRARIAYAEYLQEEHVQPKLRAYLGTRARMIRVERL